MKKMTAMMVVTIVALFWLPALADTLEKVTLVGQVEVADQDAHLFPFSPCRWQLYIRRFQSRKTHDSGWCLPQRRFPFQ